MIAMAAAALEKPKKAKGTGKSQTQRKPVPKRATAKKSALRAGTPSRPKTVQMNVRIDEATKEAGDAAFARIGLTPSQAVRMVWEFAAQHVNDPEALRSLLDKLNKNQENGSASSEQTRRVEALHEGWALIDNFRKEHDLICTVPEDDDERMAYYEQLREEALQERLEERGLL